MSEARDLLELLCELVSRQNDPDEPADEWKDAVDKIVAKSQKYLKENPND